MGEFERMRLMSPKEFQNYLLDCQIQKLEAERQHTGANFVRSAYIDRQIELKNG